MAAPVDPRLLRAAPAVRRYILATGLAQAVATVLLIGRGILIGVIAASVIERREADFPLLFCLLTLTVLAHGAAAGWSTRLSLRAAGDSIDELRRSALHALEGEDPRVVESNAGLWRHVLTRGMDDFRPYLTDFLPSLVAVVVATPAALIAIFSFDTLSGILALVTLPLIPAFMVLIGTLTASRTRRRLRISAGLGTQVADLLRGAPTLRAAHMTHWPAAHIRKTGARHADATMGVLRLAFLSSFALEFLATLSVALVAVSIGLRLVYGEMSLLAGLVVLIIVPEVFAPVRRVGTNYHAAADGLAALNIVLTLLDAPPRVSGGYLTRSGTGVSVTDLSVTGRDGTLPHRLTFSANAGEITVLRGPNGAGKSTTFLALLGVLPDADVTGTLRLGGDVAYLAPRPALVPGTVSSNLQLFGPVAESYELPVEPGREVLAGERGISTGQRQLIGLARALGTDAEILLLDEPTAHLSPERVTEVLCWLRGQARAGRVVLVASHDRRVADAADRVVEL